MRRGLLLLLFALLMPLAAASMPSQNPAAEGEEDPRDYLNTLQKEAATFRLDRLAIVIDAEADRDAIAARDEAQGLLDAQSWKPATKIATKAFKRNRYLASDAVLGDLKRIVVIGNAKLGKIANVREELARLWLFFPDYSRVSEAMEAALVTAEENQRFSAQLDLDAESPGDVISIDGGAYASEVIKLFHFLSDYGDRVNIGARADLGLARAHLLGGDPKDLSPSRYAYNDFLARHPRHELTFTALCELALTHLVTYRGKLYDVGALINASLIIEQAELVAGDDPDKAALVAKYRMRIRGWLQDRDLSVARWYAKRDNPSWLAWLKEPSGYNWNDAARFYYEEVIKRDATSPQARAAEREVTALPASEKDPFRADLLPDQR